MDYSQLSDGELRTKLEDGILVQELESTEGWKVFEESCRRLSENAKRALLDVPADKTTTIIELQVMAKLYGKVLKSVVDTFKQESRIAWNELVERGVNFTE